MPINWEDFDNNIKNTKYPLILIKQFFSSLEKINDNYATIMLRYIIKNNLNIFIDNPFYVIGKKISSKTHNNTLNTLLSFYDLLKLKFKILNKIKEWFNSYELTSAALDIAGLTFTDLGDVNSPDGIKGYARVQAAVKDARNNHKLLVALGGDNSITYSVASGLWADLTNVGLITFDAHHDLHAR